MTCDGESVVVLAVVGAVLWGALQLSPPAAPVDLRIPWWLLALMFAATEIWVFHVQVGREAQSISISEIPLVLATLGSARALDLESEIGSLTPGKRADVTVLSLAGSPYLPWEDPATAVVFGGSPDRVLLTMTEGEPRYRKGGETWPRRSLHSAAASARRRMLGLATPAAS